MLIYLQMIESEEERSKFKEIYETYRMLMFYVAKRILGNDHDAEDAVHNAFIAIMKNLNKISEVHCPKTKSYVVIIVENKAIDMLRKQKHRQRMEVLSYDDAIAGIEFSLPGDHGLADAMAKLPSKYRNALLMRYDMGYNTKEIADAFGVSPASIRWHIRKAKELLSKQLYDDGGER